MAAGLVIGPIFYRLAIGVDQEFCEIPLDARAEQSPAFIL